MPSYLNNYVVNLDLSLMPSSHNHDYSCLCHDGNCLSFHTILNCHGWIITSLKNHVIMVIKFVLLNQIIIMKITSNV
jgi:hypothetical protein